MSRRFLIPVPDAETCEGGVVRGQSLDGWATCSWDGGVHVDHVEQLDILRVHTRNSWYELLMLAGCPGEMLVRGGRYFPEWTRVHFLGASLGRALLKRHSVHVGMRMEFSWSGRRIVTSPVDTIERQAVAHDAVPC